MGNLFIRWFLTSLPHHGVTSVLGRFARSPYSRRLIPYYIRFYDVDVREPELAVEEYDSLASFFTRRLKPGARNVEAGCPLVSPVDGVVSELGVLHDATILQAKGQSYSLLKLLGESIDVTSLIGGTYITIYLSPKDYHRIHAPCQSSLRSWTHIPGRLFPVNRLGLSIRELYARNERLISEFHSSFGQFLMVKVGALGVGSIHTEYTPKWNELRGGRKVVKKVADWSAGPGDEIGYFELGSTVILIFPPGTVREFDVRPGEAVQVGRPLAHSVHDSLQ